MFSCLCSFYLSCLFALSLGDWMDVRGLIGFLSLFVVCGVYGASLDEGISKGNRKYEGRYLSMRSLRCFIWGFGVVLIYLRDW